MKSDSKVFMESSKVVIVGAGGVGNVVAHKCAQLPEIFGEIVLASRTKSKCDYIAKNVYDRCSVDIRTIGIDADDVCQTTRFLMVEQPDLLINVALPYQDLNLMEACRVAGVHYLDTANYESPEEAKFEYRQQWEQHNQFREAGLTALLGSGFDPGVTNVFCAYAQKHLFDQIETIDIMDANAGDHGHSFATNFNPEINIREVSADGWYWENGKWNKVEPMSMHQVYDFPVVGKQDAYLLYHEEMESLVRNIHGLKRIRFWMTFSDEYLTHLKALQNVGMTSIQPIEFQGQKIQPLEFLKAVLPDPASLGPHTTGKTCIGCDITGIKNGERKRVFIYNSCDHQDCYNEVSGQAVSYTTGVPAMIGAQMILKGMWDTPGVWNMEQFDPDPFMQQLNLCGLPWEVIDLPVQS